VKIGILGGSFDPIHLGHEALARLAIEALSLDELRFMPARNPPHKARFQAPDADRLAMLELVAAKDSRYTIDLRELREERVSYTVLSLRDIRSELGADSPLFFIIGWDSLQNIDSWWHWQEMFELSNIAVAGRPGFDRAVGSKLEAMLDQYTVELDQLEAKSAGQLVFLGSSMVELASTAIRDAFSSSVKRVDMAKKYLHEDVANYAIAHDLYHFPIKRGQTVTYHE
jgi:nicotinate-nucleotide adenylyltransferase